MPNKGREEKSFVVACLDVQAFEKTADFHYEPEITVEDRSRCTQTELSFNCVSTQTPVPHTKNAWTQWEPKILSEEETEKLLNSFNLRYAIRKCSTRIEKALLETSYFTSFARDWDKLLG
ncbi:uncharacterized protein LOC136035078 [Artemia franciscana]|uniref:uncharacterized protein LOC136035078 n=1 Tax=Artemia franciscana TaxID=6661 RepID=UPI0032DB8BD3